MSVDVNIPCYQSYWQRFWKHVALPNDLSTLHSLMIRRRIPGGRNFGYPERPLNEIMKAQSGALINAGFGQVRYEIMNLFHGSYLGRQGPLMRYKSTAIGGVPRGFMTSFPV